MTGDLEHSGVRTWQRNAGRVGEREERVGGWVGGAGDLLLSGDLMRVAEEEDRRLLMPASDDCFRFMVDVERLSTRREEERQTREAGFTLEVSQRGWACGYKLGRTRFWETLVICNGRWGAPLIYPKESYSTSVYADVIHPLTCWLNVTAAHLH